MQKQGTGGMVRHAGVAIAVWLGLQSIAMAARPLPAGGPLIATPTAADSVDLVWRDFSPNELGFRVERREGAAGTWDVAGTTTFTSFRDSGLQGGTLYEYQVWSYNASGDARSAPSTTVTTKNLPAAPSGVTAVPGEGRVNLYWTRNSTNEVGFHIERAIGSTNALWIPLGAVGAGVTNFQNTGLITGTRYFYRLRGYNSDGESAYSESVEAIPLNLPLAPSQLALSAEGLAMTLRWVDNASNEVGFTVYRKIGVGGSWTNIGGTGASAGVTGAVSFVDGGLSPAVPYVYRVAAFNADGMSAFTLEARGDVLAPPRDLIVTPISTNRIDLGWVDDATTESGFLVQRSLDGTNFGVSVGLTGADATGHVDWTVSPGVYYHYRVAATNRGGRSDFSLPGYAKSFSRPAAPSDLTATVVQGGSTLQVKWRDNSENEDSFDIAWSMDGLDYFPQESLESNVVSYLTYCDVPPATWINPVNPCPPPDGNPYPPYWRVCASNQWGVSDTCAVTQTVISTGLNVTFYADQTVGYVTNSGTLSIRAYDVSTGSYNPAENDWTLYHNNNNPVANVQGAHTGPLLLRTPGVYALELTVSGGADGTATLKKDNYITVIGLPPPPTVVFTNVSPTLALAPASVTFTNLSTGVIERVTWDFNGDGIIDAVDPEDPIKFVYDMPGIYSPSVTARGPGGSTTRQLADFIVITAQPPVAAFGVLRQAGEVPFEVTFIDNAAGSVTNRLWDFDADGTWDAVNPEEPITHTYTNVGFRSVVYGVSGPLGEDELRRNYFIRVLPWSNHYPRAETDADVIYLPSLGEQAELRANPDGDPDGDPLSYSWRESPFNPVRGLIPLGIDSLAALDVSFPVPGRYTFDLVVNDGLLNSEHSTSVTVLAPGLRGTVAMSYSDNLIRIPDARISAHTSLSDAQSNQNAEDVMISDSFGRYVLENVAPLNTEAARTYHIRVARQGFSNAVSELLIRPDPDVDNSDRRFEINRGRLGTAVTGVVMDAFNTVAIPGATVVIVPGLGGTNFADVTDAAGRFTLPDVPVGSWLMQVWSTGNFSPQARDITVAPGMDEVRIKLERTSAQSILRGRITAEGTGLPVIGARLVLGATEATSDSVGEYQFADIPPGVYPLTITGDGYETLRLPAVRVKDEAENVLDIRLFFADGGLTVSGTVKDGRRGYPIPNASVGVQVTGERLGFVDVTDGTGYFQMNGLPPGQHTFEVEASGYDVNTLTVALHDSRIIDFPMERGWSWRFPLGIDTNAPVAQVDPVQVYVTNRVALLKLTALNPPGPGVVYIWRESADNPAQNLLPAGAGNWSTNTIVVPGFPQPGTYIFELQVSRNGFLSRNKATCVVYVPGLRGHVHASPSAGVFGLHATVRAYTNYAQAEQFQFADAVDMDTTDVAFNYMLDQLGTGSYWVAASATTNGYSPYGPVRRRVNLGTGTRVTPINIPRAEFALSGVVLDEDDGVTPVDNVRLIIPGASLTESFRATTDAEGRYRFSTVPSGSHQMLVSKEGWLAKAVSVNIGGATTHDVMLEENVSGTSATLSGVVETLYEGIALPLPYAEVILGGGTTRVLTDKDGRFEIPSLVPGAYYGIVRKSGYRTTLLANNATGIFSLPGGATEMNVMMSFVDERGPVIRGIVVDARGDYIPGATAAVAGDVPSFGKRAVRAVTTNVTETADAGGVVQLAGLPHGERDVTITTPNGRTWTQRMLVSGQGEIAFRMPKVFQDVDDWKSQFFTVPFGEDGLDDADPDGDGFSNLAEFVMDTNPTNFTDAAWNVGDISNAAPGQVGVRFVVTSSSTGRYYAIFHTTNLMADEWALDTQERFGTGQALELTATNSSSLPALFYRLGVRWPYDWDYPE